MQAMSEAFKTAVRNSHRMITKVEFVDSGVVRMVSSPVSGSVRADYSSDVRRSCSVSIADDNGVLTPSDAQDLVTPFGNMMRIYRGIKFLDGTEEYILLGTFTIWDVEVVDNKNEHSININGYDSSKLISVNSWIDPLVINAGTNYIYAIATMIGDRAPGLSMSLMDTTYTTPKLTFGDNDGGDPWRDILDQADSIGFQAYVSVDNYATVRPWPDLIDDPNVWDYEEGDNGVLLSVTTGYSRDDGYNIAVVTGESSSIGSPPRAVVQDLDPTSPTYVNGKYGKKPTFWSSDKITNLAQATDAAIGLLRRHAGVSQGVNFNAIVNPAHEPGDIIQVTRAKSKLNNRYVIQSLDVPLSYAEPMRATCRLKQVVA